VVEEAQAHFSPEELAQLVWALVVINSWSSAAITSRMPLPPVRE
jgi:hypothetical protein